MDKTTLLRLATLLPEDATEIIVKGHDAEEIFFCSEHDCSNYAFKAQRGSYRGDKVRWRVGRAQAQSLVAPTPAPAPTPPQQPAAQPIDVSNLPTE